MSDNPKKSVPADDQPSNLVKDPEDWVTGDEPMTGAQASYLKTLSEEAGVPFDDGLTKADASKRIDELQGQTGRGQPAAAEGHAAGARAAHGHEGPGRRASRHGPSSSRGTRDRRSRHAR